MKIKKLKIILFIMIIIFTGYNINHSHDVNNLSSLVLEDVEALARYELPDVVITCDSGSSGKCFDMSYEEGLYGYCSYSCDFTGYADDYCSSFFVDLVNLCSAMGAG